MSLPGRAYLVMHFATGQSQLDFSNGSADYYTGDDPGTPVWDQGSDEAAPGQSIARDTFSTDTNTTADFDVPGRDALDITPGRQNADDFSFETVPSDAAQTSRRPRAAPAAQWTVLLYFATDNNLAPFAHQRDR